MECHSLCRFLGDVLEIYRHCPFSTIWRGITLSSLRAGSRWSAGENWSTSAWHSREPEIEWRSRKTLSWHLFTRPLPAGSLCSLSLTCVLQRWACSQAIQLAMRQVIYISFLTSIKTSLNIKNQLFSWALWHNFHQFKLNGNTGTRSGKSMENAGR